MDITLDIVFEDENIVEKFISVGNTDKKKSKNFEICYGLDGYSVIFTHSVR